MRWWGRAMLVEASPPHSASRTPRVGSEGEEKRRMINLERVHARFVAPIESSGTGEMIFLL